MAVLDILLLACILLLPLLYFSKYNKQRRRIAEAVDKFNGPRWYPIIGTTWSQLVTSKKDLFEHLCRRPELYGPMFRSWVGPIPVVHVNKAKHAEVILKSNVNLKKGANYEFIRTWLGEGLITGGGAQWQRHRKLITPTFHFKILDDFQDIFYEKAHLLVEQLLPLADGKFFDVYPYITHCALDIICETAMGVEINAMECADSKYIKALYRVTETIMARYFRPWLHPDFIFKRTAIGKEQKEVISYIRKFVGRVIEDRKRKLEDSSGINELSEEDILLGKKRKLAFLDLLLQHNKERNELTDTEITEEVDTFMFAGHDTTTGSTCWTLFSLGNHPEIQDRVHQEIDSVFHGEDRPITPEDLTKLQYLERVMKESLRLNSIVPWVLRELTEDIELDGKLVPAGVTVAISIYHVHRDPEQYPDPTVFDPDRFLPENVSTRNPYAFIPFSAGPRNCLGQKFAMRNTKTLLATILRKYRVTSKLKPDEVKCNGDMVLKPQQGVLLSFKAR